jgi:hypothetical protein
MGGHYARGDTEPEGFRACEKSLTAESAEIAEPKILRIFCGLGVLRGKTS